MALSYLTDMLRGHARRYIGHSPAAGVMIAALLFCLLATVGTGLVACGDNGKGPLANTGGNVTAQAHADEGEGRSEGGDAGRGEGEAGIVGELHGMLANITLGLVILNILGVGLSSLMHRENLVGAMFSGRKHAGDEV